MRQSSWIRVCLAMVAVAVLTQPSMAQSTDGTVRGRVTDETGGVLPGVTVELRSKDGMPVVAVTDATGIYEFAHVAPGTYQLNLSLINFASANRRDVVVRAGETATDD